MTRDQIIRLAREAGIVVTGDAVWKLCEYGVDLFQRAINAERELAEAKDELNDRRKFSYAVELALEGFKGDYIEIIKELVAAKKSVEPAIKESLTVAEPVAWMTRFDDPERSSYGKIATTHLTQDEAERQAQRHIQLSLFTPPHRAGNGSG